MQRFAVYLKTVQRRGYPPLPHIWVDSEPPVSVLDTSLCVQARSLSLLYESTSFKKIAVSFFCIEKTALSDGFLFRLCFGFVLGLVRLLCVIDASDFPDNRNFDLSGVFEFRFQLVGDFFCKENRGGVVDDLRFDHNADFAPCLNCVRLFNAIEGICDCFQLFNAFDVVFKRFATCAGTCA